MRVVCCICFALVATTTSAQPLLRAHAHNDYEHDRPLLDALDHGFISIEADIHLVDGALLVAHDRDDVVPGRTLEALYLAPLRSHIQQQGGQVYPTDSPLLLLIDIKSEAEVTYAVLRPLLQRYADILTSFTPSKTQPGPVLALLSGNRPRATLEAEPLRFAALDGRLSDLGTNADPAFVPLISDSWWAFARWYGDGPLPDSLRTRLDEVVRQTHAEGRMIRFWATTDNPAIWQVLYDAGVDLLNADDLSALRAFLLDQ